jgi:hypothetical protein
MGTLLFSQACEKGFSTLLNLVFRPHAGIPRSEFAAIIAISYPRWNRGGGARVIIASRLRLPAQEYLP